MPFCSSARFVVATRWLLPIALVVAAGCVGARVTPYSPNTTLPPTSPTSVQAFYTVPPMPFERIGEVEAHGPPAASWDRVVDVLREEAAKIGGEAVIVGDRRQEFRMFHPTMGPLFEKRLVGVVIRFPRAAPSPLLSSPLVSGLASLTGTYQGVVRGTLAGQPVEAAITFTIMQSGSAIQGVWTTSSGSAGTMAGTLNGQTIPEFRALQMKPCSGEFRGVATVVDSGMRLEGRYVGQDCAGSLDAVFVAERQP
jgi:hypothetical protein